MYSLLRITTFRHKNKSKYLRESILIPDDAIPAMGLFS